MALVIGSLLALTVGIFATSQGLDRDRAFYPVVTIVIASYYALFAVMGASMNAFILESLLVARVLSCVRCYGSGIFGMAAQERSHSCNSRQPSGA